MLERIGVPKRKSVCDVVEKQKVCLKERKRKRKRERERECVCEIKK